MSKNILLTGGVGYIGSHTSALLDASGYNIFILDNLSNSDLKSYSSLCSLLNRKIPFFEGDIRDKKLVKSIFIENKIDVVIHFAGLKSVGESVIDPLNYYSNNVYGTLNLLESMKECSVHNLIFSSSATVYGEPHYLPIDEEHPTSATNPYGQTKLQIEQILESLSFTSTWNIICLRYFNPVGAHDSFQIGENPKGVPNNLMPIIARVANGDIPFLKIFGDDYPTPDGTGVRDYIHVVDLANGHLAALNYLAKSSGINFFNLGTGFGYSVLDMIKTYEKVSGLKVPYEIVNRRDGDVASCFANPKKANEILGWSANKSMLDMCYSTFMYQKSLS